MKDFLSVVAASRLFSGIRPEELEELLQCMDCKQISFSKGQYILQSGEAASALGLILEGHVLIVKEDFWGNRNLISSMGPGQCFAETFACAPGSVLNVSAVADSPAVVLFLNVQKVLSAASGVQSHAVLIKNLLSDMAGKNLAFTEKLTHLGQRSTRAKLLSYLSAQSQKQGCVEFDIPFSRQQLADYLFVERSGLSMELCKMRDEGLLEFHKNHFILKEKHQ